MSRQRPNIIWICTEHQRGDTIGALGNDVIRTPNLDRLVATGTAMTRAYSQATVCTPSRASFLTGRYPTTTRCRQNGQDMPTTETLIIKDLRDHGYDCGLVGKLHISHAEDGWEPRIDDGYDFYQWSHGSTAKHGGAWVKWLETRGKTFDDVYERSEAPLSYRVKDARFHQCHWCIDQGIEFIRTRGQSPWLLSINPFSVHDPYEYIQEDFAAYDPDLIGDPLYHPGELANKPVNQQQEKDARLYDLPGPYDTLTKDQLRQMRRAYYAAVTFMDRQVGRLLDFLETNALRENTLIVFHSDHGDMQGDHGLFRKGAAMYDPVVRAPLIFSMPGTIPQGKISEALCGLIDIAPTFYELLGLEIPPRIQGKSLLPILTGDRPDSEHREGIYAEYYNCNSAKSFNSFQRCYMTMWREDRYKIIVHHHVNDGELYDMHEDPHEFINLWNDPARRELRDAMIKRCFAETVYNLVDPEPVKTAGF